MPDRNCRTNGTLLSGTRLGEVRIERIHCRCRACGLGFHPLDRELGLEGRTATPGAESLYADAASSDSCGQARRKLRNMVGVEVPTSTLQCHVAGIGEEMQAFERADAEASPAAERVLPGIDGTGVPMAAREVEGVAGKQADGEAKAVVCCEVDSLDPKAVSVRIDSAQAVNGAGRASEFAARMEQFTHRNGVFAAEEVVVLSDGAPWIRTVCEEILPGRKTTFILDLCHALEYAAAAVQAAAPDEANRDRMRCDLYRKRGLPVGSGIVESACKRIVGSRLKGAGRRWSKAGANAVLAIGRCLENRCWADFLDWRACRAPAA